MERRDLEAKAERTKDQARAELQSAIQRALAGGLTWPEIVSMLTERDADASSGKLHEERERSRKNS